MSSEVFLQLVQLCTILIGLLSVAVTLRSHRRQMHAQMYIEFSSRLHHLLRTLPAQAWMDHPAEGEQLPPRDEELTKSCLQCFHVIADLYRLHQAGYITDELWRPSQRGIQRAMQRPLLRREWLAVETNFDHDPHLCRYMRRLAAARSAPEHSRSEKAVPARQSSKPHLF
jgi:hypothetical protein